MDGLALAISQNLDLDMARVFQKLLQVHHIVIEGGFGFDPESGSDNRAHSTENMCALVAGRAGGLVPGQHIRATGMHPANVILSAMTAAGYTGNSLGDISGVVDGLFS